MDAIITELIQDQPFQIIQNRIAEILAVEITNQKALQGLDSDFEVYVERIEPYASTEDVLITISSKQQENVEYTQSQSKTENLYFIDIFAGGIENGNQSLSENVRLKLFKYVGLVKYILNSGKYDTLGFPKGLIMNRHIKRITFDTEYSNWGNHSNYDAMGIRFCRLIYMVTAIESTENWEGIPLQGNTTKINNKIKLIK